MRWLRRRGVAIIIWTLALATRAGAEPPPVTDVRLQEATELDAQVNALYDQGRYAEALPLAKKSLEIREHVLGPDDALTSVSLTGLASLLQASGELSAARPLFERALAIDEKALGPSDLDTAADLTNLGSLFRDLGDLSAARRFDERALAIYEKVRGATHPDTATGLGNLASLLREMGELAVARPLCERALAIREKALGPDHPETARSLANLALLLQALGEFGAARPLFERALAIDEKALGPEHPGTATDLTNLGRLLKTMGDLGAARPLYERALAISEKALGPDHPETATVRGNLGVLLEELGDLRGARPLLERTLADDEKALGPDHSAVATDLDSLGLLLEAQGELRAARPLLERALAIREKALGPRHPETATSLNNLALLLKELGELGAARALYVRALSVTERALGAGHRETGIVLENLAALEEQLGDLPAAIGHTARALGVEEQNLGAMLASGTEAQKSRYLETLQGMTDAAITLHVLRAPTDARALGLAFETVLRRKARVLDASADQNARLRERLSAADRPLLDQLVEARRLYATLVMLPPSELAPAALRARVDAAAGAMSRLEATLGRKSEAFASATRTVTLGAVQRRLPPKSALVELVVYTPFDAAAQGASRWGAARYAAYVLPARGAPRGVDLGDAAAIDAAAKALRLAIAQQRSDVRVQARALGARVMDKVRPLVGAATTLILSPDGELAQVPFDALVDAEDRWLVERYHISYLSSGRDLVRQAARPKAAAPPVLMADIDFDAAGAGNPPEVAARGASRSGDRAFGELHWGQLAGTAAEADGLTPLTAFAGAQVLRRGDATELALRQVRGPRILHIATHGFFLAAPPSGSLGESPLLRSGIVLAGANLGQRAPSGDDGVLTALEAAALDLDGTELVVLSACETGVGDAHPGEGVFGLQRALVLAGARTQVMSLWKVDDAATQALMVAYYQRLAQGEGRAEAMRQVRLAMLSGDKTAQTLSTGARTPCQDAACEDGDDGGAALADWKHPYFWASFTVSGEVGPLGPKPGTTHSRR